MTYREFSYNMAWYKRFNSRQLCRFSLYSTTNSVRQSKREAECKKVVSEAEKIIGYPTSFLSLRWLLNDEVANVANHLKKLIGTNHPLLASVRDLIIGDRTPTWGLIVLLVSKAGGLGKDFADMDKDVTAGILHSQRVVAEVTEMIRTSNILHNSVLNIYTKDLEKYSNLNFGNTISLLTGDYLLTSSFKEIAGVRNQEVTELVALGLRDLTEAQFIKPRDKQSRPLPAKPLPSRSELNLNDQFGPDAIKISEALGNAKAEWILRNFLSNASLLAKCCQGALKLANHPEDCQKRGYLIGRNTALALQAYYDLAIFEENRSGPFSLIAAPVLFHLQHDPDFYSEILKGSVDASKCDFQKIMTVVRQGPGMEETRKLKREFVDKTLEVLEEMKESDARMALQNIVNVL